MEPRAISSGESPAAVELSHGVLRGLVQAALDMSGELDQRTLLTASLNAACSTLSADGSSFWVPDEQQATCQLAIGLGAETVRGSTVPLTVLNTVDVNAYTLAVPVVTGGRTAGYLRVARDAHDARSPFAASDRELLALLADSTASALQTAARLKANDRSGDLTLVEELSREIGSSLDLDRVLQTVVNIAAKAVRFDLGALALYEKGKCDIRAVAGSAAVDSNAEEMQDLAFRAAWAAGTGEMFYLSDREAPGSDTERIFLQFFEAELAKVEMQSGLYLPLRDEEGIVGILLLESKTAEFASVRERELARILANQATVAIRNAKLYSQVPLAEALGAISAKRAEFFAIPRRRRAIGGVSALITLALVTLVRWPLRVVANTPVFRPTSFATVRPLVSGTVDRVLVREGSEVAAGAPLAQLRDIEARAARLSAEATIRSAEREAVVAASRGDAAGQRLQDIRATSARATLAVRDEAFQTLTLRAPVSGTVLTARPELLIDTKLRAGDAFVMLGRTDTLELEFSVEQREIDRVRAGDAVRIRVDALPQRTIEGRVTWIGALPLPATLSTTLVHFPVRALVPNADGAIRPGMGANARVLTAPASLAERLLRTPTRVVRLMWWRMWSWV
ncbi:MAG: efflux RND transporter periplasmic adaptor subunit [Gemmatimonadaceae bacterium]|nr:efflux RND transporter periplasmic adaptor subunit [Gemmatimonadaceae bacterium]